MSGRRRRPRLLEQGRLVAHRDAVYRVALVTSERATLEWVRGPAHVREFVTYGGQRVRVEEPISPRTVYVSPAAALELVRET